MEPTTNINRILKGINVLAWLALIIFAVEVVGVSGCYAISYLNPEKAAHIYKGWDLYPLKHFSSIHFTLAVIFSVALSAIKAFTCFLIIRILQKVKLVNPFTLQVTTLIGKISFILVLTSLLAALINFHARWIFNETGIREAKPDAFGYIFVAGLVFVIAQIFKRGVEIQTENDLTV
jgi:TRAP-type mannitol/chloroaromatic compound transport system permease small subunit